MEIPFGRLEGSGQDRNLGGKLNTESVLKVMALEGMAQKDCAEEKRGPQTVRGAPLSDSWEEGEEPVKAAELARLQRGREWSRAQDVVRAKRM